MLGCNEIQEIGKYSILNSDNDTSMHPSGRSVATILLYKASVCCFLSPPVEVMKTGLSHSEGCSHSLVVCEICSTQEQELDFKQKRFVSSQPWSRYPGNTSCGLSPCIAFFFGPELGKVNLDS